jgi:hypothetical protein
MAPRSADGTRCSSFCLELAIEKGTGLAAEKRVLAIEKGTAWDAGMLNWVELI